MQFKCVINALNVLNTPSKTVFQILFEILKSHHRWSLLKINLQNFLCRKPFFNQHSYVELHYFSNRLLSYAWSFYLRSDCSCTFTFSRRKIAKSDGVFTCFFGLNNYHILVAFSNNKLSNRNILSRLFRNYWIMKGSVYLNGYL